MYIWCDHTYSIYEGWVRLAKLPVSPCIFKAGTIYGFPGWSRWLIPLHRDRAPASTTEGLGVPERKSHNGFPSGEVQVVACSAPKYNACFLLPRSLEKVLALLFRWRNQGIDREGSSLGGLTACVSLRLSTGSPWRRNSQVPHPYALLL